MAATWIPTAAGTARVAAARLRPAAALRGAAGTALGPAARPAVPPPRRKPWPARHKVASGFIAAGCIAVIAAAANAASTPSRPAANASTATTAAVAAPSASAAPDCLSQAKAWASANSQVVSSFATDLGTFGTAGQQFASDLNAGVPRTPTCRPCRTRRPPSSPTRRLLRQAPAPSCVPGLQANLTAAARSYSAGAGDATNAMNQYSAWQRGRGVGGHRGSKHGTRGREREAGCGYGGYQ